MTNYATPKAEAEADASASRVEFTAEENALLCEAVADAVSEVLGMPTVVDFFPEAATFLVEVVGRAELGELH